MCTDGTLEREVAGIGDLPRDDLVARWQKTYGCLPPKGINRGLLERSAAWHMQAGKLGGLSAAARATLKAGQRLRRQGRHDRSLQVGASVQDCNQGDGVGVAGRGPDPAVGPSSGRMGAAPPLAIGTRLMREWNGRMHVVDVTAEGVVFDGKLYRSLTAVAKRITGTHWSGPRFFGL